MKHFLLSFAILAAMAKIIQPLPISFVRRPMQKPAQNFIDAEIEYTASQAEKTATLLRNVLERLPTTEPYEPHRKALEKLLQNALDFKTPGLCHNKMRAFSRSWTSVMVKYLRPDSSPQHDEILALLEQYGLKSMMMEAEHFLERIVSGEIGLPVEEGSPSYVKFLEREC
ncbi:uncharacterized protein LOC101900077 [Musca domestica]|uniref:Uncharacterized protein LOC101900077 n=1 Tax=Musca domestica TaxID=7370 RepID=A0A9J7CNZ6_MUSDO|nr:uncharacterized protein LOC101900077 [Musca domestica]